MLFSTGLTIEVGSRRCAVGIVFSRVSCGIFFSKKEKRRREIEKGVVENCSKRV